MTKVLRALAWAVLVLGVLVALLAPASVFDAVLAWLIGIRTHANTTSAQRGIAAVGAVMGGLALRTLSTTRAEARLPRVPAARCAAGALALSGLLVENFVRLGASMSVWRYPPSMPWWWNLALAGLVASGSVAVLLPGDHVPETHSPERPIFVLAVGGGAAYGCFSALWHCCLPPWIPSWRGATTELAWFAALALLLAAVARLGASAAAGMGEVVGGLLFAGLYPWHTPLFASQAFVGGALATWLVRCCGSAWAPALALATAYATHVVLPFVGWAGVAAATTLLGVQIACALRNSERPARSRGIQSAPCTPP